MRTKGKAPAQSYNEMTEGMKQEKEKGLALSKGNSLYKQQSGEYKKGELSALISCETQKLVETATKERISLSNVEKVKKRTIVYLRACEETSTFPSALGLARSLGYSDRALRYWRSKHPETELAQWFEMFGELCVDILNQSALENNANSIVAIFLNKAMYGFRETNELVITPNARVEEEAAYSAEEIRKRYIAEGGDENASNTI